MAKKFEYDISVIFIVYFSGFFDKTDKNRIFRKILQKYPDPPADAEVCYYCKYGRNDWKLVKTCNNLTCGGKKGNKLSCDCTDYVE